MILLRGRRAATLVELIFFGALASIVAGSMIGLLARGNRLVELGRRSSASMEDMRVLLEHLGRDAEELAYLEQPLGYDSDGGGNGFALVVRSSRQEIGLQTPPGTSLRRVEYKVQQSSDPAAPRVCVRTVSFGAPGSGSVGPGSSRPVATSLKRLRIEPLVALPADPPVAGSPLFTLIAPADPRAATPGAQTICLVIDVCVGERLPAASADPTTETSIATKLWCRNRLLQLARGGYKR